MLFRSVDGDGTKEKPFTVAQAMKAENQGGKDNGNFVWVKGYIVGTSNSGGDFVPQFSTDNASASNFVLADNKDDTDASKVMPSQLVWQTAVREDLNLQHNPGMYKAQVLLRGTLEPYFTVPGFKNLDEYELITPGEGGTTPEPDEPVDPSEYIMYDPLAADLGTFTEYSVEGVNTWHGDEFAGDKYIKVSGYNNETQASDPNEDWLISPAMDLSKVSKAELSFSHLVGHTSGKEAEELTVWISSNYSSGNPTDATWEQITVTYPPKHPTSNFSDWQEEAVSIPASMIGKTGVRVAYKYVSGNSGAMTWEVMKVGVK